MKLNIIDRIIQDFDIAGYRSEADRLRGFKSKLFSNNESEKKDGAENIIGFCHIKAWGDLNMADRCESYKSNQDWINSLEELRRFAKKAVR